MRDARLRPHRTAPRAQPAARHTRRRQPPPCPHRRLRDPPGPAIPEPALLTTLALDHRLSRALDGGAHVLRVVRTVAASTPADHAHRRRPRAARPPALHALDTPPEPVHEAALLVRTLYHDGTADVPAAELVAALDGFFADSTPLDAHATACCRELLWAVGKTAKDRADVLAAATDGVAFRALAAPLPRALVPDVVRFARRLCAASPAFLDIGVSLAARHVPALIASRPRLATSSASASGQRPSAATRRPSTCAPSRSSLRR